ncbi:unnamed protein product [Bemisia tabaci]|uniref:AAA-ATPase-like domain-containing protein n=1 Tax=Bemisia tabaci TaxID=7038 RepID=A0A9P0A4W3_BEMTA|nr:unnamed protein product [Bemisia tabaci]
MQRSSIFFLASILLLLIQVVISSDKKSVQAEAGLRFSKTGKPTAKSVIRLLPLIETDFKEIVDNEIIFVDKTAWIRHAVEFSRHTDTKKPPGFISIARPPGFGKSINLSMLRYFLDSSINSSKLFTGLEISKPKHQSFRQQHQNKYVVFYFDFNTESRPGVLEVIKNVLKEQSKNNRQLLDTKTHDEIQKVLNITSPEQGPLLDAFSTLCNALLRGKRKFVVLVDNADKPYLPAFVKGELLTDDGGILAEESAKVFEFMRTIYSRLYSHKPVLGIMLGTTLVPDLESSHKNPILEDDFASDFGFTDNEVQDLILEASSDIVISNVRVWYEGYHFGDNAIYSPVSVVMAITSGKFKPFSCEKDGALLGDLIKKGGFYARLQLGVLMDDVPLEQPVLGELDLSKTRDKETIFWTFLVHAGFLDVNRTKEHGTPHLVRIPNLEVKEYLKEHVIETPPHKEQEYKNFTDGLLISNRTDSNEFPELFKKFLKKKCALFGPSYLKEPKNFARYTVGLLAGLTPTHRLVQITEEKFSDVFVHAREQDSVIALRFIALKGDNTSIAESTKSLIDADPEDPTSDKPHRPMVLRVVYPIADEMMLGVFDEKPEGAGAGGMFGDYSDFFSQFGEKESGYDVISGYPDQPPQF